MQAAQPLAQPDPALVLPLPAPTPRFTRFTRHFHNRGRGRGGDGRGQSGGRHFGRGRMQLPQRQSKYRTAIRCLPSPRCLRCSLPSTHFGHWRGWVIHPRHPVANQTSSTLGAGCTFPFDALMACNHNRTIQLCPLCCAVDSTSVAALLVTEIHGVVYLCRWPKPRESHPRPPIMLANLRQGPLA